MTERAISTGDAAEHVEPHLVATIVRAEGCAPARGCC